ncbi:hypothetical protein [Lentzea jiangxiensis]|uniref:Uncharacterized protein n=1 Tax=Lentzea jiangxiensis TaxID=641025 RepID=A0A1H0WRU4_9PSEU|nr:hypothetical protein [Lentzea jiangxiensis]SDP93437.1 hypothetical protein SAMN05421507_1229 [Lentzea jiangxiensis]
MALGELHNLAGWACFDTGLADSTRVHFAQALVLTGWSRHNGLVAIPVARRPRRWAVGVKAGFVLDHYGEE